MPSSSVLSQINKPILYGPYGRHKILGYHKIADDHWLIMAQYGEPEVYFSVFEWKKDPHNIGDKYHYPVGRVGFGSLAEATVNFMGRMHEESN